MDNTTGLAAQMAYMLLFALVPGSLFLWHLLGLFGTDPARLHRMFFLLKSFMPPDQKVQEILDATMANVVVTGSSGPARMTCRCARRVPPPLAGEGRGRGGGKIFLRISKVGPISS